MGKKHNKLSFKERGLEAIALRYNQSGASVLDLKDPKVLAKVNILAERALQFSKKNRRKLR